MMDEMVRFNEAIDQSLTESVRQYSLRVSQTRDRFTGVLAHDLRSPLGAIANSAELLLLNEYVSPSCVKAIANIQRSTTRMRRMIDDLLDFARTRLGDHLPLSVLPLDAGRLCSNACEEVSASYPHYGQPRWGNDPLKRDSRRLKPDILRHCMLAIVHIR